MDYKKFFDLNGCVEIIDPYGCRICSIEDLYRAFKARLEAEDANLDFIMHEKTFHKYEDSDKCPECKK